MLSRYIDFIHQKGGFKPFSNRYLLQKLYITPELYMFQSCTHIGAVSDDLMLTAAI